MRVPAKVNLALGVGQLQENGYHAITTVFQAISLYDDITATPADDISVTVVGEGRGFGDVIGAGVLGGPSREVPEDWVPVDESNLAVRAARLLAQRTGVPFGVALHLAKGIPVAGGMAGGSADAAAALVACDVLWDTGLDRRDLTELARELGSDVPFALTGGTALGVGRGDVLTPVLARGTYHWVLALAARGLSTPSVYAEYDRIGKVGPSSPEGVIAALRAGDAVALGASLVNDLQPAALALRPDLRRVLDAGRELGAVGSVVSGSGPTVALLARDSAAATGIAAALSGLGVCRGVRRAHGPVPGARILEASA